MKLQKKALSGYHQKTLAFESYKTWMILKDHVKGYTDLM